MLKNLAKIVQDVESNCIKDKCRVFYNELVSQLNHLGESNVKKSIRTISLTLVSIMMASMITACGSNSNSPSSTSSNSATASPGSDATKKAPAKITMFLDAAKAKNPTYTDLVSEYNALGGDQVEVNVLPGDGVAAMQKMDILMSSGDTTDVVVLDNPLIQKKYAAAGYLAPINDLAKTANVDLEKTFGQYLAKEDDGKSYYLRTDVGQWYVFYNKQLFDDAKVPYPSGKWTWSQYIETAKKLTNTQKGIYGSLMLDYDNYLNFTARQKNVPAYKKDGTSNYDDPAYKDALKFFGDLGNVQKIQPSWLEFKTQKVAWDAFMSGKYGMHLIGGWYMGLLTDKKSYPITWKWGITQVPVPDSGDGDRTLVAGGAFGVNSKSKNKDASFKFVNYLAQNAYKKGKGIPPLQSITDADKTAVLKGIADASDGSVTVDDLRKVIFDSGLGVADEKISGPGASIISQTILQEGELYMVGQKSLDDAIGAIKKKSDEAIKADAKK
ncbi:extracellular solute-binding protein [Paenibacillus sp. HWE-109]|uniref:ABC transporter substrate-binding protein n=1 Tax=Paenibacillus sp. HWE-109 TaxID=1306526 RepID=UPI001EDE4781|nr:extracellular solute-binding protein [Paenibacillus sp. HWE-109]UKS28168.1 extracellular solute-binding protein [Paenibacillus sp. HWE-109]